MRQPGTLSVWLAALALLCGCEKNEDFQARRQKQYSDASAKYFFHTCVEAIERYRADAKLPGNAVPRELQGQDCLSDKLGDYTLKGNQTVDLDTVKSSRIELQADRLSGYILTVEAASGRKFVYRDRGTKAAELEEQTSIEDVSDAPSAEEIEEIRQQTEGTDDSGGGQP